ncbi:MAG: 3-oxoacyl-ACP synthase [Acidimicrobiia bacterium]|nr:3-oxoacyl-ACP synthase [Acidimicrobiia bacterium]
MTAVNIVDVASWLPERWMTAAEIGELADIDEQIIVERFGLEGKHIAGPQDHNSDMSARAGLLALERSGVLPEEVDVVAYFGSMWRDYEVWSVSPKIMQLVGATNAWALEMANVSCGAPVALKVAADFLRGAEDADTLLLVGASRESHLLDYSNQRSRFMFNFGDGGAAAVLSKSRPGHEIISSAIITDGEFADDVAVYAGGSKHPASHETIDSGMHFLDVHDPAAMKERLDPVSGPNFIKVARQAVERAGITFDDLALMVPLHFKRSFFDWVLGELGLPEEKTVYLKTTGHMSGIDPIVGLAERRTTLQPGDHVLLISAGTGYTWAANIVRW